MSKTEKKLLILVLILALVLAALVVGVRMWSEYRYQNDHIFVEDAVYRKDAASLDLRGTGISLAHYETVRQQLPNCVIAWELPFQGGCVDAAAE